MTKPDSIRSNVVGSRSQHIGYAIGIVCAIILALFSWGAGPGLRELKKPDAKNSFYNLQTEGFRAGQLNLMEEAPIALTQFSNPYDPAVNGPFQYDYGDMSYYKGKFYLYFGPAPALVLYWPCLAITGKYMPDSDAVFIFLSLGFLTMTWLLFAIWRRYFPEVNLGILILGIFALGLALGTLQAEWWWSDVYEVSQSCGFAFAMLALAAIWQAIHSEKWKIVWLFLASTAYGLAIASRISLLFGAIILLLPLFQEWCSADDIRSRWKAALLILPIAIPLLLIGGGLMVYNNLRFDNPFEFGWRYQLGGYVRYTAGRYFDLHFLWFNFSYYFLEPIRWVGHFPFLKTHQPVLPPAGHESARKSSGGIILVNYPLLWLALASPLAWKERTARETALLRWFIIGLFLLFVTCAMTICLVCSTESRYELDFLPALILLSLLGILGLERKIAGSQPWRQPARWVWLLLLAYSITFNVFATVDGHELAYCYDGNFLERRGDLDDALQCYRNAALLEPKSASYAGLGTVYWRQGDIQAAIAQYRKALSIEPDFEDASIIQNNLACCLLEQGQVKEAITHLNKSLEINPHFAEAQYNLGRCFFQLGLINEAVSHLEKSFDIDPNFAKNSSYYVENNDLAWAFATAPEAGERNGALAVKLAEAACEATHYQITVMIGTLAAAYAEAGRFDDAVATTQKTIALARQNGETNLVQTNQKLLTLYQKHLAYHRDESDAAK